ncbi:MAG: hypothetical protein LBI99_03120 [Propionibacteriaceae bacterium]|jgi:hypothetical protein|nr:hypothetical protein [Propionibacteriaceae bacterium]
MVLKRIAASVVVALLGSMGVVAVSAPTQASAADCRTAPYYTSTAPGSSTVFVTSGTSACDHLYAAGAKSYADEVKGWYKKSGKWKEGTRGYVPVPLGNAGWKILLSDIQNSITVRGETLSHSQNIQYVW